MEKRVYLGMLKFWVNDKGYNPKMVLAKYKSRFDCWPTNAIKDVAPIEPDRKFLNLMKYDFIRHAKRNKKNDNKAARDALRRGGELIEKYQESING